MNIKLMEFSVENFKIFKQKVTFSMISRKNDYTFKSSDYNLLKSSIIYGPNASGKSTLLEALQIMTSGVIDSHNNEVGAELPYFDFLLSDEEERPIFWELVFVLEKKIFKYNFSILKDEIVSENLFEILSNETEKPYFTRKGQKINLSYSFNKGDDILTKTRKEVLFLSAAAQWNDDLAMQIVKAFKKNINILNGIRNEQYGSFTAKLFKDDQNARDKILNFLKKADFCINDAIIEEMDISDDVRKQLQSVQSAKKLPKTFTTINFLHPKFNSKKEEVGFEKINMTDESIGTQKFFDLLGPVIDTLEKGKVLLIDEFDNSLHPKLTKFILDLFEKQNPNNAQLIVTTHDTSLLSYKGSVDKVQIWFTEKDQFGSSRLFSLAEFKLRNDTEFAKKYLEGRFGALPFIDFL